MEIQWPLIVFTLLVCTASGTFAGQGLLALLGKGQKLQLPAAVVSLAALAAGGIASFLHLQHADRLFNGFGHITSGITQELIGIVVFFVVGVIYLVLARKGNLPKWAAALALLCGLGMVLVTANSYIMPARPVWATPLLHLFYLTQAVVCGGAVLWLLAAACKAEDALRLTARATAVGGALVVLSMAAYAVYIATVSLPEINYYFDPTDPTKSIAPVSGFGNMLLAGSLASYFWSALVFGGAIAAILGFLKWSKTDNALPFAGIALACALLGGVVFRAALYILGVSVFVFY